MAKRDEHIEKLIDAQNQGGKNSSNTSSDEVNEYSFEFELQDKIDASLRRSFSSQPMDVESHRASVKEMISGSETKTGRIGIQRSKAWGLAASILILIGAGWWLLNGTTADVDFQRQPLAKLYHETVQRGFQPYYVCDEPVRFAQEFKNRQGVALRLTDMPEKCSMVGISYLGGISRDTTTMLGLASNKPVLVFVDKISNDDDQMRRQVGQNDRCFVTRTAKHGLVFYEVSEYEEPQLTGYFEEAN